MQSNKAELTRLDQNDYSISGPVDFSTVPDLALRAKEFFKSYGKSAPTKVANAETNEVTVTTDMSQITEFNSAGLALLLEMYKLARQNNIKCRFINLPAPLMTIAKAYGVEREIRAICR